MPVEKANRLPENIAQGQAIFGLRKGIKLNQLEFGDAIGWGNTESARQKVGRIERGDAGIDSSELDGIVSFFVNTTGLPEVDVREKLDPSTKRRGDIQEHFGNLGRVMGGVLLRTTREPDAGYKGPKIEALQDMYRRIDARKRIAPAAFRDGHAQRLLGHLVTGGDFLGELRAFNMFCNTGDDPRQELDYQRVELAIDFFDTPKPTSGPIGLVAAEDQGIKLVGALLDTTRNSEQVLIIHNVDPQATWDRDEWETYQGSMLLAASRHVEVSSYYVYEDDSERDALWEKMLVEQERFGIRVRTVSRDRLTQENPNSPVVNMAVIERGLSVLLPTQRRLPNGSHMISFEGIVPPLTDDYIGSLERAADIAQ